MRRRLMLGLVMVVAGCGGGPSAPAPNDAAGTPEAAVRNFMQAVADSNITRMGRYWGTSRGPAAITRQPADYEDRMVVTQAYLRRSPFRITGATAVQNASDRQQVQVEFERQDADGTRCTRTAPFTVLRSGNQGWIVVAIDLNQVGAPGRACSQPSPK